MSAAECYLDTAPSPDGPGRVEITTCPRCGQHHPTVTLSALDRPIPPAWTHWAPCPETAQPILFSLPAAGEP